jgi:hypothetical protein
VNLLVGGDDPGVQLASALLQHAPVGHLVGEGADTSDRSSIVHAALIVGWTPTGNPRAIARTVDLGVKTWNLRSVGIGTAGP